MAARFADAQPGTVVAVTGTNGKTSVAHFTRQLWAALGFKAGYLGTLGAWAPDFQVDGSLTTPDPVRLHSLLADMTRHGTTHLAMEASSHGLHQFRIDGVRVAIGAFTNLSRDHLDYHGSMAAYLSAKLRLFTDVVAPGGVAVLNADSSEFTAFDAALPYARPACDRPTADAMAMRYSRLHSADIDGDGQRLALHRLRQTLCRASAARRRIPSQQRLVRAGLRACRRRRSRPRSVAALATLTGVPGRLEQVGQHRAVRRFTWTTPIRPMPWRPYWWRCGRMSPDPAV